MKPQLVASTGGCSPAVTSSWLSSTQKMQGRDDIWDLTTGTNPTTHTTLQGHTSWVNSVAFSPDGTLLATTSGDGTTRIWEAGTGAALVTLAELAEGGWASLFADGYKLDGAVGNELWWAIKLCRFAPGELDPYVPGLQRFPLYAPIPLRPGSTLAG